MLVIFDTETTGLNAQYDYIIQLSAIKLDDDFNEVARFNEYIQPIGSYTMNPKAVEVHGITEEFLKDKPTMREVGPRFLEFIDGCDLGGYNSNRFDILFLYKELANIGLELDMDRNFIDIFAIETTLNGNKLENVFKRYTGKTMADAGLDAHDAMSDVLATTEVLKHQLKHYSLPEMFELDVCKMGSPEGSIRRADNDTLVFNIGKYKDRDIRDVVLEDKGYMRWWAENVASSYSKKLVKEYLSK